MPLVRVQVRNEYGLGNPELYGEGRTEDPKAVLDGVAVAGFVGILRQLGDLAGFAEEVFHGIQEEVANTSSRSHKLVARLQRIEAAIAPVEKVILAQKNHLHFAYTPGCFYHTHLENEQNHFINSELPQFIEEYYEECSVPPCLQLLDKFDTGGPGSCLKRYSDPSFFSRASASSCEANVTKLSKEKKAHGSKENMKNKQKKRTRKRNLVSHAASLSKQNDRVNIDSVEVEEHISPQTVSPSDVAMKSDQESQLNSFDSRSNSGFIECIFRSNHSTGFEEQELKESCVWNLGPSEHNSLHSASVDEHSQVPDNEDDEHVELLDSGFLHSSPQDPTGPISHGVAWVEKKEIVEPTGNQYYPSGTAEISEMNIDRDIEDKEAGTISSVKERDSSEGAAVSESSKIELDSSTETLEIVVSDSESDTNFQMKHKMEELFNYNDIGVQEGLHMLMTHPPDLQTRMEELPEIISSECYAKEESPDMIKVSPVISNNSGLYLGGHNESSGGSFLESNASSITDPGIRQAIPTAPEDVKVIRSSSKTCGGQTVQFWTNGSLLGLEPSKPPVFGELNDDCLKSLTRSANDVVPSSKSDIFIGNSDAGKLDTVQSSESIKESLLKSSARHIDQHPISKNTTSEVSPTKLNGKSSNYEHGLLETSKVVSQSTQAVHPDVRALPTEAIQEGGDILIPIFGNRFLNNIQREVSVAHDATSQPHSSRNNGFLEQKTRNRSDASKGCFIAGNTLNSPSSSPPLEHVKISFQPINGSEIGSANLKLKFSDGSSRDVLPSFQLIHEPSPPQYSANSDSDNDTFCRSSPYLSDDCLSHQSDLNSELWESDGTPSRKDKSLSDAISRISLSESASRIREHGEPGHGNNFYIDYGLLCPKDETCLEPRQSTQWCDLPNWSTLNPLFELDANESE